MRRALCALCVILVLLAMMPTAGMADYDRVTYDKASLTTGETVALAFSDIASTPPFPYDTADSLDFQTTNASVARFLRWGNDERTQAYFECVGVGECQVQMIASRGDYVLTVVQPIEVSTATAPVEPDITAGPEATVAPEVTVAPEITVAPTVTPAPTSTPKPTVKPAATEKPTLTLNKKGTVSLTVGKTLQLKATIKPKGTNPKLTWTSAKTDIAKVNKKGKVTAKKPGITTITVTAPNVKKAKVYIKVVPVKPTSISFIKGKKITMKAGRNMPLKVEFKPKNASSKLTWKSGDKKIATVSSDGVVSTKKPGKVKITVKTENGKKASIFVNVK